MLTVTSPLAWTGNLFEILETKETECCSCVCLKETFGTNVQTKSCMCKGLNLIKTVS